MRYEITGFSGTFPAISPVRLPVNAATVAENCRVDRGILQSAKGLQDYRALNLAEVKSLYRYGAVPGDIKSGHLFEWGQVVDCVPAPLPENHSDIVLIAGDGEPKITDNSLALGSSRKPVASYRLGVPQPSSSPYVEVSGDPADGARRFRRDYLVTFLCQMGSYVMEGKPSAPSIPVEMETGQTCTVKGINQPPQGAYHFIGKRLYRRSNYSGSGSFQLVAELPVTTETFTDNKDDTAIPGDVIREFVLDADMPPAGLFTMGALPNGLCFGTDGEAVFYSFPYQVHAWGAFNRTPIKHKVIGVGHFENVIVALTSENPVIITGENPSLMNPDELTIGQGCVSRRSIVSGSFGVAYASPDGLTVVTGAGADVATSDLMDRDSWQALNPASVIGALYEGAYLGAFTRKDGSRGVFLFDPKKRDQGILFYDLAIDGMASDGLADTVFAVSGDRVKLWAMGDELPLRWRSRVSMTDPIKLNTCRVKHDGSLRMRLWRDGVKVFDAPVNRRAFRLPAGRGSQWQVELEGTGKVYAVILATSMSEV
ncbi:hypothetical protein NX722_28380 [Endozoicomonas gorgoniicola]|uniref:Phage tail protein n=1 Tax=Endozoicomonas gorgoniicola TaxID=1234144 RepID=A0ABT3N5L4_9GAMM|nr:hypothetical protein [Endozoicomonas gorgoniicola]MCW7556484.1 hypothetical protein [Endozoicomonas gorgoniicola]